MEFIGQTGELEGRDVPRRGLVLLAREEYFPAQNGNLFRSGDAQLHLRRAYFEHLDLNIFPDQKRFTRPATDYEHTSSFRPLETWVTGCS
jgi:hypothetical protein